MTPSEVSDVLSQTPAPREQRVADVAARLAFPRVDRVLIFVLSFGLLPALIGAAYGLVVILFRTSLASLPESVIPWLFFAFLLTWIAGTAFYIRRRHKQFVDVAQHGALGHVADVAVLSPPGSTRLADDRALIKAHKRHVILVGGYQGVLTTVGLKGVLVKPGNRRALALQVNGIVGARVTWKTNLPTATALNE